jgi:pimeloyl-ACP methyl ester carboxylesterase
MSTFLPKIKNIFIGLFILVVGLFAIFYQPDRSVEDLIPIYTNDNSRFISLYGMNVHYRDEGVRSDSIPLVLIHGTSSSLHTFEKVVDSLKKYRRVITLDLPGFGLTGPNEENEYSCSYYARFLATFFKFIDVTVCDIGGNSLGGGIAWYYTVAHPTKVRKLFLIDATGFPDNNLNATLGFKLAAIPVLNNLIKYITPKFIIRKSLVGVYGDTSLVTQELVDRYHDMAIRKGNRKALVNLFNNRKKLDYKKLSTITCPTLIIWGEKDSLIPVTNAYLFEKYIKGSKLIVLQDVGHAPNEEVPEIVAELILNF